MRFLVKVEDKLNSLVGTDLDTQVERVGGPRGKLVISQSSVYYNKKIIGDYIFTGSKIEPRTGIAESKTFGANSLMIRLKTGDVLVSSYVSEAVGGASSLHDNSFVGYFIFTGIMTKDIRKSKVFDKKFLCRISVKSIKGVEFLSFNFEKNFL